MPFLLQLWEGRPLNLYWDTAGSRSWPKGVQPCSACLLVSFGSPCCANILIQTETPGPFFGFMFATASSGSGKVPGLQWTCMTVHSGGGDRGSSQMVSLRWFLVFAQTWMLWQMNLVLNTMGVLIPAATAKLMSMSRIGRTSCPLRGSWQPCTLPASGGQGLGTSTGCLHCPASQFWRASQMPCTSSIKEQTPTTMHLWSNCSHITSCQPHRNKIWKPLWSTWSWHTRTSEGWHSHLDIGFSSAIHSQVQIQMQIQVQVALEIVLETTYAQYTITVSSTISSAVCPWIHSLSSAIHTQVQIQIHFQVQVVLQIILDTHIISIQVQFQVQVQVRFTLESILGNSSRSQHPDQQLQCQMEVWVV